MAEQSTFVDLAFPLIGASVPLDHGYALFGALSRVMPRLHEEPTWGVHPVLGRREGPGVLSLTRQSSMKLRLPVDAIAHALVLTGAELEIDGGTVRLGAPRVFPLVPSVSLRARFVTIKGFPEEDGFLDAVKKQIAQLPDLRQDPERVELALGPRRVLRIKSHKVVGHALAIGNLDAATSVALQVAGVGGRRHFGSGIFVPPPRRLPHA